MGEKISLRKYPYPYRCALTICSDLDDVTPEDFLEMHRFLNTVQLTSMGTGLGLEIADSFWMYSAQPFSRNCLSYFKGVEPVEGPWAGMIADFIRAGYIDCLHTYGDFNHYGGFRRDMAVRAVERLHEKGIRIPVWTNHGDRHNFQNIADQNALGDVRHWQSANGDSFESVEYHLDLTRSLGIEFSWRNVDLTQIWGQDRPLRLRDLCPLERMRHPRTYLKWLFPTLRAGIGASGANAIFTPIQLRDGSTLYAFKRYGWFRHDRSDDVMRMLSDTQLEQLVRDEAVAVLYTHLGKRVNRQGPVFSEGTQAGLRRLAAAFREGRIFVTTTSRLLKYCLMQQRVGYTVSEHDTGIHISLRPTAEPEDFAGLTFYVNSPQKPRLFLSDREIELEENSPDHTGRRSVSVPLRWLSPESLERYYKLSCS